MLGCSLWKCLMCLHSLGKSTYECLPLSRLCTLRYRLCLTSAKITHSTCNLMRNVHDVSVVDCRTSAYILEWPDGETRPSLFGCQSSRSREVTDVFLVSLITPFTKTLLSSPVLIRTAPPLWNINSPLHPRQCFISRGKRNTDESTGLLKTLTEKQRFARIQWNAPLKEWPIEISFLSVCCVCLELHQEVSEHCSSICYARLFARFPTLGTQDLFLTHWCWCFVLFCFFHTMGRSFLRLNDLGKNLCVHTYTYFTRIFPS